MSLFALQQILLLLLHERDFVLFFLSANLLRDTLFEHHGLGRSARCSSIDVLLAKVCK